MPQNRRMESGQVVLEAHSSPKPKRRRAQEYSPIFSVLEEEEGSAASAYSMEVEEEKQELVVEQEEELEEGEKELESEEKTVQIHELEQIQEQDSTSEDEEFYPEDFPISLTLADPDVLNCLICYEPLRVPVFQCKNGHPSCFSCYLRPQKNNCPLCSMPVRNNRCYGVEKILEALKTPCPNKKYGCQEKVKYESINDDEHYNSCIYEPCCCPHLGCNFLASYKDLPLHYSRKHKDSGIKFVFDHYHRVSLNYNDEILVFQEKNDGVLLILNIEDRDIGKAVNISSIGPKSLMQMFKHEISAEFSGSSVKLRSFTRSKPTGFFVDEVVLSEFLLIPSYFFDHSGKLELEICIHRVG